MGCIRFGGNTFDNALGIDLDPDIDSSDARRTRTSKYLISIRPLECIDGRSVELRPLPSDFSIIVIDVDVTLKEISDQNQIDDDVTKFPR